MSSVEAKFTPGPWAAHNMVGEDAGRPMTPEEIGEYVAAAVRFTAANGGASDRYLFVSAGTDGPDICHVGNGPLGPHNARLIAAAPDFYSVVDDGIPLLEAVLADREEANGEEDEVLRDMIARMRGVRARATGGSQ